MAPLKQFQYIEDYMLFIAGRTVSPLVFLVQSSWGVSPISLANYDVRFITSVANQIESKTPLTDRQHELAVKLVLNYKKQLLALRIGVPGSSEEFQTRLGVRTVNRKKSVAMVGDRIHLSFPFDQNMIQSVKNSYSVTNGSIVWDGDLKVWVMSIVEGTVSWVCSFAAVHGFTVDDRVCELFELIAEVEKTNFKIELIRTDGKYEITNAPKTLAKFIEPFITDKYKLIDYSGLCDYAVSDEIRKEIENEKGKNFYKYCRASVSYFPNYTTSDIEEMILWARATNRLPVVVYSARHSSEIDQELRNYGTVSLSKQPDDMAPDIYYTNTIIDVESKLLISYPALLFGSKLAWASKFEKVFYLSENIKRDE